MPFFVWLTHLPNVLILEYEQDRLQQIPIAMAGQMRPGSVATEPTAGFQHRDQ
jgi:hypothetical protein